MITAQQAKILTEQAREEITKIPEGEIRNIYAKKFEDFMESFYANVEYLAKEECQSGVRLELFPTTDNKTKRQHLTDELVEGIKNAIISSGYSDVKVFKREGDFIHEGYIVEACW